MIKKIIFRIISAVFIFQMIFMDLYSNNISIDLLRQRSFLAPSSLFRDSFDDLKQDGNRVVEYQIGNKLNKERDKIALIKLWEKLNSQLEYFPEKDDFYNISRDDLDAITILKIGLRAATAIKIQILDADPQWVNNAAQSTYLFVRMLRHPSVLSNISILDELLYICQDFIRFGEAPSSAFNIHLYNSFTDSLSKNNNSTFFTSRKQLILWISVMKLSIDQNSDNIKRVAARQLGKVLFPSLWPEGKLFNPGETQMKVHEIWNILFKDSDDFHIIDFNRGKGLNPTMRGFDVLELPLSFIREKGIKPLFNNRLGTLVSSVLMLNSFRLPNINLKKSYALIVGIPLVLSLFFGYADFSFLNSNPYKNIDSAEKILVMENEQEIAIKSLNMINSLAIQSKKELEDNFENIRNVTLQLMKTIDFSISSLITHDKKLKGYRIYLEDNYHGHYLIEYLKILEKDTEGVISFRFKQDIFITDKQGTVEFIDVESLISWISINKGEITKNELDNFTMQLRVRLSENKGYRDPFYGFRIDIKRSIKMLRSTLGKEKVNDVNIKKTIKTLEMIVKILPPLPEMKTDWKKGYFRDLKRQNYYNKWIFSVCKFYVLPQIIFKSIMLQETSGKKWVSNRHGFAGLMQTGFQETIDAGYSTGKTKLKKNNKGELYWSYDKEGDDRFDPFKSIQIAAFEFNRKMSRIDNFFKDNDIGKPFNDIEKWKLYIAAYNIGGGTVIRAINNRYDGSGNVIKWKDLITSKSGKLEDSAIYEEMPEEWNRKAKYGEITSFVSGVWKRASQSSEPLSVLNEFNWEGMSETEQNILWIIEKNFIKSFRHHLPERDLESFMQKLKKSNPAEFQVCA